MNTDLNAVLTAPVPASLGGRTFAFAPLTFDSYAKLQAWIKAHRPHPFEQLKALKKQILASLGPAEYKALLAQTFEEAKSWPPSPLGMAGRQILLSEEDGGLELIRVALAQVGEALPAGELEAFVKAASAEEVIAVINILFGISPRDECERAVLAETDPAPKA